MGKKRATKDRGYITSKEHKEEWGGYKERKAAPFQRLPFHCCAITFTPFEDPVCTGETAAGSHSGASAMAVALPVVLLRCGLHALQHSTSPASPPFLYTLRAARTTHDTHRGWYRIRHHEHRALRQEVWPSPRQRHTAVARRPHPSQLS
jgi:hypothetical protein